MKAMILPTGADNPNGLDDLGRPGLRWSVSFLLMTALFGGMAWITIHWTPGTAPPPLAALMPPAIMIDLAPLSSPAVPPSEPTDTSPGPRQTQSRLLAPPLAQPKVTRPPPPGPAPGIRQTEPPVLPPPALDVAPRLASEPPTRLPAARSQRSHVRRVPTVRPDHMLPAPASSMASHVAAPATSAPASAAPTSATPAPPSNAVPTWQGHLLDRLEQFKQYPKAAQDRRQQGVSYLRFVIDREGRVLSARIEKTSGHDVLDQETLALIQRAQPLPRPPPTINADRIELVVPIEFFLGRRP